MEIAKPKSYPVTFKRTGWSTPAAVVVVLAVLTTWYMWPRIFIWVGVLLAMSYVLILQIRFSFFEDYELKIQDDAWLVEYDSTGKEVGRFDLSTPFEAEYLFKGNNCALYQLTQGKTRLRFSAETKGAEHVVRDILRLQWPPFVFSWPLS